MCTLPPCASPPRRPVASCPVWVRRNAWQSPAELRSSPDPVPTRMGALQRAHEKARIMGNPVSDIACVRHAMRFGGANWTPTNFASAASQCAYWQSDDPLGITNPRQLPLDLRDDPELQRMAEDPAINDAGPGKIWDYMRRDGTSTNGYYQ